MTGPHIDFSQQSARSEAPAGDNSTVILSGGISRTPLPDSPELDSPRYCLLERLEEGGMGTVFRARDLRLDRDVAVKILRVDSADGDSAAKAFTNEARVISSLPHPGIPPVYDCGRTKAQQPYHVMKLVHGTTLLSLLQQGTAHPARLLSIFADICQTMAFAHSRGVIHLDLKPANVMLGSYGEVYVMDWGLARFETAPGDDCISWDAAVGEGSPVGIAGTLAYMSPEQAVGGSLDARTDVFGLGAILCEILTGRTPYSGNNLLQVHRKALHASMHEVLEELEVCDSDSALVRLTRRCLAPRPRDRPRDAGEVAGEVSLYQESALQRAENDLTRFFELSLDLFCIADFNGFFRRINSNFSRVLGHTDRELLGRPFMDFVHPDDIAQTIRQMSILNYGEPVVRFRNRYRKTDGTYVTLEWTAKAISDEKMIFAVARDITSD